MSFKDQIVFDPSLTLDEQDSVGAFIRAGTDGDLISSGDGDSDNIANTFEGLDTRSFAYGYDATGDNWDRLKATAGALNVFIDGGDFEIDVVIYAEKAEDSTHTTGDIGNYVLAVQQNTLAASADDGDYASFKVNGSGELYTTDTGATALLSTIDADTSTINTNLADLTKAEDAVHNTGDKGIMPLAVRRDANTALAADGDYIPLTTDDDGNLWVNVAQTDVAGGLGVQDIANTAIENTAKSVTTTTAALLTGQLANRKFMFVQNLGPQRIYVGKAGVTTSNGIQLSKGSLLELRLGAALSLHAVTSAATADARLMELS